MRAINSPNEPEIIKATIFRCLDAATKRLASGDSLVKRPTLPARTGLWVRFVVFTADLMRRAGFVGFKAWLFATFCARLAASGVTEAGALGNPFVALFFTGPGRFNLLL